MKLIKRFRFLIVTLLIISGVTVFNYSLGIEALGIAGYSFKEMLLIIPPVFILLGLLDVWVPREIMMRYIGVGSGIKGVVLAFLLGSAAAGPLYAAFPVAAVFMKKGVKFENVLIFIGAWSTTKIPMFLFELSALGSTFAVTRLIVDIPGIIIIAYILRTVTPNDKIEFLYNNAAKL